MRSFKPSIPVIFGLILLFAGQVVAAQVNTSSAPDTLNRLDDLGRKEGWWQLLAPLPEKVGYAAGAVVEEGRYTDNKRTGIWRHYWPNGKVKSCLLYTSDAADERSSVDLGGRRIIKKKNTSEHDGCRKP